MGIGETNPFRREPIQVGSGDLRFRIVAAHIPITEIISEDKDNVGFERGGGRCCRSARRAKARKGDTARQERVCEFAATRSSGHKKIDRLNLVILGPASSNGQEQ